MAAWMRLNRACSIEFMGIPVRIEYSIARMDCATSTWSRRQGHLVEVLQKILDPPDGPRTNLGRNLKTDQKIEVLVPVRWRTGLTAWHGDGAAIPNLAVSGKLNACAGLKKGSMNQFLVQQAPWIWYFGIRAVA
jgi:hypothetical protein